MTAVLRFAQRPLNRASEAGFEPAWQLARRLQARAESVINRAGINRPQLANTPSVFSRLTFQWLEGLHCRHARPRVNAMYPIRELSRQTNVPARTIRYYEGIGLLAPARRGGNGYRLYDATDAERLGFIRSARTLNFSLAEIAQILAVRDRYDPPCQHVMDLIRAHMDDVEIRIRELQELKHELGAIHQAGQGLPEDVQMRSCVCHLIQVRVSGGTKGK